MGIDYGHGKTNIDTKTGIRFGVIPHHAIGQAWYDSAEGDYGDPHCPKCGNACVEYDDGTHGDYGNCNGGGYRSCADYACVQCELYGEASDYYGDVPVSHDLEDGEYRATQSNDDCDIFVLESPYYTKCGFCSPCAPGAGYLLSESDDCKAYCFGHDWFDDGVAPYTVYSVATGEIVQPTSKV